MNTTARILSKCHELESELLISDWVYDRVTMPKYLKAEAMGAYQLKGKQQEVELYSVFLAVAKDAGARRRRRRLFRRKMQKA